MSKLRSSLLVCGIALLLAAMFAINRIPGLEAPEIGENRVLAPPPPFSLTAKGLHGLRTGLDAYVADNFPARKHLVAGINYLRYRLGYSVVPRVLVGEGGWLFYDNGGHLAQMRPSSLAAESARSWVNTFASRTEVLKSRKMTYLAVVPPVKERVYPERAPAWAVTDPDSSDADVLARLTRAAGYRNLLVLRPVLLAARATQARIYSPFDTHWTGYGAYIGYREVLAELTRQGHPMAPLPLSHFAPLQKQGLAQPQDLALMLGVASFIQQDFPQFHDPVAAASVRTQYLTNRHDWTGDRVIDTGSAGKPVMVVTGDSFMNELLPFLYPHFSRIVVAHNGDTFFRPDLVDSYAPDVVMLEVHEPELRLAMSVGAAGVAIRPVESYEIVKGDLAVPYKVRPCTLDSLTHVTDPQGRTTLEAMGWMADVDAGRVAREATLVLKSWSSAYQAVFPINVERLDVAAFFAKPQLKRSGFYFIVEAGGLDPGKYDAYLVQKYGTQSLTCVTERQIDIRK